MHSTVADPVPLPSLAEPSPPILGAALDGARRRWRWLLAATLAGAVAGVPLSLTLTRWYLAGVRMIPAPSRRSVPNLAAIEPLPGALPDDTSGPGGADGAAELGRLLSILHSRSLTDDAIRRFHLDAAFGARSMEDARGLFWSRLATATLQAKEGYVDLQFEDQDPARAADVANFMAAQANEIVRRISSAAASQERLFLERRLEEAERDLRRAEEEMTRFQRDNKLINLDQQSGAVLTTMLQLKQRLILEELELRRVRGFASSHEPAAIQARRRIDAIEEKLAQLEHVDGAAADVFTRLDVVPELRLEGERLARQLKTKASVYELLVRQHEMAKLSQVRDTQSYEILDAAVVPTKKSRPSRSVAILAFALLGFGLAFVVAGARGAWPVVSSRLG